MCTSSDTMCPGDFDDGPSGCSAKACKKKCVTAVDSKCKKATCYKVTTCKK